MTTGSTRFSSDRERRLWFWAVAAVVAIYSTLGVADVVADALRDRNLLRVSIGAAVVVVLGPIAWRWIRARPDWREVGAVLGVAFAYWMVAVRVASWEERTHLIEYAVVAALIHMALLERRRNGRAVPRPAALAVVATTVIGLVDELIQAVLPNRVFDVADVFFNVVAAFLVIAARLALAPQSRPGWRLWFLWLWATAFGWGQGVYLAWSAPGDPKMLDPVPDDLLGGFAGVVSGAALVGVLQWLVVRRYLPSGVRWLMTIAAAVALTGLVMVGLGSVDRELGWLVGVGLLGSLAGVLQWPLLRRVAPRAGWWVVAGAGAWLIGLPLGDVNGPPGLGAAYGAITAAALVWLLRRAATYT